MVPLNPPLACAPAEDLQPSQVRHFSTLKAKNHLCWKLGSCLDTVADKIAKRRPEWLGHIARMPEHCIPKMALFGWLPKTRPPGGPSKRWRDQIRKDLKVVGISESEWYDEATCSREGWCTTYCIGLGTSFGPQNQRQESASQSRAVECGICRISFRRESDKKRHKCVAQ